MHWKTKAMIQNIISILPAPISYEIYYFMQRRFAGLRITNPIDDFKASIIIWKKILDLGHDPSGKVFFEIGTGRFINLPLSLYLMGAGKVITIDLNPYLKTELVDESLAFIVNNINEVKSIFGSLLHDHRLEQLIRFYKESPFSLSRLLDHCQIDYIAPSNAASTGLSSGSVDFHVSHNVLEHISPKVLKDIFEEGNRIIRVNGLFIHGIDYSDHFSHSDKSISNINFLQYSNDEWNKYANNRYMYMNRLRHDDYLDLINSSGQNIITCITSKNDELLKLIHTGSISLAHQFKNKSNDILAITGSLIISQKDCNNKT